MGGDGRTGSFSVDGGHVPQFRRARCPHRAAGWFFSQKEFRRPGGEFLSARAERNQRTAKGWAQSAGTALPPLPPCRPPPGPPFTGVTPWTRQNISGAQNLSGWSKSPPGHWALALQKLKLVQFKNCAWLCRTNAPGPYPGGSPKGLPYANPEGLLNPRRGGDDSPYQGEMSSAARQRG